MKTVIFVLLLLVSVPVHADDWSGADVHREVLYQALGIIDWAQTRAISFEKYRPCTSTANSNGSSSYTCASDEWYKNPQEQNPILGPRPSKDRINLYFVACAVAHYFISDALSPENRAAWQNVSIGFEASVVYRNFSLGIGIKF